MRVLRMAAWAIALVGSVLFSYSGEVYAGSITSIRLLNVPIPFYSNANFRNSADFRFKDGAVCGSGINVPPNFFSRKPERSSPQICSN